MIQRSPLVCWGLIDDDLLLWSVQDRRLHVLNATAANVWLLADEATTVDEMIQALAESYGVEPERIEGDVSALVQRFLDAGLCVSEGAFALRPPPIPESFDRVEPSQPLGPFRAMGVPLIVETNDPELRVELDRILDPLRDDVLDLDTLDPDRELVHIHVRETSGIWEVVSNGAIVSRTSTKPHALRAVLSECNAGPLRVLDSALVFHAAAADLGDGLVLFPGVSNSGKSTLVTQLVQRGHGYLTDEAVAVEVGSLHARPFHKSICIEEGSQHLVPELSPDTSITKTWDVDPRTVGSGRLSPGGLIKAIVFPTFDPSLAPEIRPLTPFDTMQLLLSNAFEFERVGQPAFAAMIRMANALPAYTFRHAGGSGPLETLENLFARTFAGSQ